MHAYVISGKIIKKSWWRPSSKSKKLQPPPSGPLICKRILVARILSRALRLRIACALDKAKIHVNMIEYNPRVMVAKQIQHS